MKRISFFLFLMLSNFVCFSQIKELESVIDKCENNTCFATILKVVKEHKHPSVYRNIPAVLPIKLKQIKHLTGIKGVRFHPISKIYKVHQGIDLSAKYATEIYAPADGVVEKIITSSSGYGRYIILRHKYGFKTLYAHLSYIYVKLGQEVKKGKIIGFVGNSGSSTAPHLHYEVIKNNVKLKPSVIVNHIIESHGKNK